MSYETITTPSGLLVHISAEEDQEIAEIIREAAAADKVVIVEDLGSAYIVRDDFTLVCPLNVDDTISGDWSEVAVDLLDEGDVDDLIKRGLLRTTTLRHDDVIRTPDGRFGFCMTLKGFHEEYINDAEIVAERVKASLERGEHYATGIVRASVLTGSRAFHEQRLAEEALAIAIADGDRVIIDGRMYIVRVNPRRVSDFVKFDEA